MPNILSDAFHIADHSHGHSQGFAHGHGHEHEQNQAHGHGDHGPIKSRRSFLNMLNLNRNKSNNSTVSSIRTSSSVTSLDYLTSPEMNDENNDMANVIMDSNNANFIITSSISPNSVNRKTPHSMAELKKFFRSPIAKKKNHINMHGSPTTTTSTTNILNSNHPHHRHHHQHHHQHQRNSSVSSSKSPEQNYPSTYTSPINNSHSPHNQNSAHHRHHAQSAIPPTIESSLSLSNKIDIFHDDSILVQKYGKLGKLLGSGAGGSVKIINRPSDGATFAVKEFRPQKPKETNQEYHKKCTAEFLIGSILHHPNIIETLDIFADTKNHKYFEVMEYCPVDFFGVVMSNKMSRNEINCCIRQLGEGVKYLHDKGMAHRDLKLDNCVMTSTGILKVIDFGSAVVFKYPFEENIVMAHGIVGSDPYLAPEVLTSTDNYDPQLVDVWSIAIIYCCLMLKRFPWKLPHPETDENFKLFCLPDEMEHDYYESARTHEKLLKERMVMKKMNHQPQYTSQMAQDQQCLPTPQQSQQINDIASIPSQAPATSQITKSSQNPGSQQHRHSNSHRKLQGPYRLLKLLPHASRPIVSRMLEIEPSKRATLVEVFNDSWFSSIGCCTMTKNKEVIRAQGHHHTIVIEDEGHVHEYRI